ncbi:G protein-activated inward rectifier potassium channel 4-like [Spodoptera frugiperda]|uniref:G protein-activated inward rectifier potassium channel 4-like n=1 Tax=Spodoptera frugiperda TaxID=7108 RepID=A0A9R0CY43_SPOFR|nr:G protein-activated inward rectifier potassium channel 4-like [Spodoptera frugiperda]
MELSEKEQLCKLDEVEKGSLNYSHKHRLCRTSQRRKSGKRKNERVVFKTGQFNLEKWKNSKYRVFPDIVQALIDAQWRWTIVYSILTYIIIWLAFTGIWWIILEIHGDFEPDHLPHAANSTWEPCVREIYSFTSLFLFSIEIHTTIGYGGRSITLECPSAMFTMCIESILGTITQSFIVGIVFAKLTRPKNRAQTLLFSKNAIINQRDRNLRLIFRVGNTRKSRIIAGNVQAYLIRHTPIDVLENQIKLGLSMDSSENFSFMFPVCAVHTIDEDSPFYSMAASDIIKADMEILVVFEGTIESTGQPVQAKSSYTTQEILWGHRFIEMVEYKKEKHGFLIDYAKFNETYPVSTPLCSAKQLNHFYEHNLRKLKDSIR